MTWLHVYQIYHVLQVIPCFTLQRQITVLVPTWTAIRMPGARTALGHSFVLVRTATLEVERFALVCTPIISISISISIISAPWSIWIFAGGMESTTGYSPPVWGLYLPWNRHSGTTVQGTTAFPKGNRER